MPMVTGFTTSFDTPFQVYMKPFLKVVALILFAFFMLHITMQPVLRDQSLKGKGDFSHVFKAPSDQHATSLTSGHSFKHKSSVLDLAPIKREYSFKISIDGYHCNLFSEIASRVFIPNIHFVSSFTKAP
jgi:hypothetical protein